LQPRRNKKVRLDFVVAAAAAATEYLFSAATKPIALISNSHIASGRMAMRPYKYRFQIT
jgi:hypothetical protein